MNKIVNIPDEESEEEKESMEKKRMLRTFLNFFFSTIFLRRSAHTLNL